ncbi:hypothetical protein [Nostoc sp.]|uniref:hypothetical protein n=1 Tax=Nostoc sp. TaxID=1180 RepID=UPI003FA5FD9C
MQLHKKLVLESIEDFTTRFPSAQEVMIDGTERPIQRLKDEHKQKSHYSGKKKRHTRFPLSDDRPK